MNYKDKKWDRVGLEFALKQFSEGKKILCTVKNGSEKLLYYTFGLNTKQNAITFNKRIIDSGWWFVENTLPEGACPYCKGNGYYIVHGREDTPEDCPECNGTGLSFKKVDQAVEDLGLSKYMSMSFSEFMKKD